MVRRGVVDNKGQHSINLPPSKRLLKARGKLASMPLPDRDGRGDGLAGLAKRRAITALSWRRMC